MSDPKMREVFEKMTGRFHIPAAQLQKDEDGEYTDKETASYWVVFGIAWAESRESLVIELPERFLVGHGQEVCWISDEKNTNHHASYDSISYESTVSAIEAAGVKVSQ